MSAPSNDLNDLQSDIGNLAHLLAVLYSQTTEQEFVVNGRRNPLADQICALAMIAAANDGTSGCRRVQSYHCRIPIPYP